MDLKELQDKRTRVGDWIENIEAKKGNKAYSIARQYAKIELNEIDLKIKNAKKSK